jgi:peptidoglycan hydrolase-like protein with peptidoglycan-binding domain
MNANQVSRTRAARENQVRALWMAGAVVAVGLACATHTWAQPSTQAGASAAASERQAAQQLSPATIRMLQHSLIQGGYEVDSTDGVWGPKTAAAVREFQRVKGLEANGLPDRRTLEALGVAAEGAAPGTPRQSATSPSRDDRPAVRTRTSADLERSTIRAIQHALDQQGLQVGPVDGVWGEQTTTAVANFQRARGMPASGELDAHTLAALGLLPGGRKGAEVARSGRVPEAADLDPAAIRLIQQALKTRGFQSGAVDGVWGKRTEDALREFQRSEGLEPVGEPEVHTLSALGLLPR